MATATQTEMRTDEQIQKDVLAEIKYDARVQPNEIGVAVKGRHRQLTGFVDSYSKKWADEAVREEALIHVILLDRGRIGGRWNQADCE